MRTAATLLPLLALALLLVGCDEKEAKDRAEQVFREYYRLKLTTEAGGRDLSDLDARDLAARRNGFANWDDFSGMGLRFLGNDAWNEIEESTRDEFVAKQLALRWIDEGVREAPAEVAAALLQEDGDDDGELPPVFRAGAKLGDPVAQEYYEIKEVRGEWIRADHYKVRGSVVDLLAKDAWVCAPSKDWDWAVYPWQK